MVTKLDKNSYLTDLMVKSLNADQEAYREFLKEISVLIRGFLIKKIGNNEHVDDILQEILISIHKAKHTYDGLRPIMPWVISIVKFRLSDWLRAHYKEKSYKKVEISEYENILEDVTNDSEESEYINKAFDVLNKKQKNILQLIYVSGFSVKEVAKKLSMSDSAVKVAAHRAYKIIKEKVKR